MSYRMFIDDERYPVDDSVIVRGYTDFYYMVVTRGFPHFISFDHDLGDGPTGMDIAKSIVDMDIEGIIDIPEDFSYYVHSQNPIGKGNIEGLLNNYLINKGATNK